VNKAPHRIDAGPETVHWGYFDARLAPVLTIESGERVVMSSVCGPPDLLPKQGFTVPPALPAIHAANAGQRFLVHMCTGPVAVRGAKPDDVLQVDIEAIDLHYDWDTTSCGRSPARCRRTFRNIARCTSRSIASG
jgi:acetamidase/formamidase